ncbi:MAG: fdnI [Ilumatobacteraceae bacterium]|nr:fdnI [Ilumatobacteraceae bacterium]
MNPSVEPAAAPSIGAPTATAPSTGATLIRFDRAERLVHRSVAILMITCMTTAAIMYNGFLSAPIGHRRFVKLVHVYSGFALPVPIILGLVSAAYRADLRRLNRFSPTDWRWLRSRTRRNGTIRVGKFNAGQKLNSALSGGAIAVLLVSGTIMYFPDLTRLAWRTGSTFVHDWFALALGLLVLGHIRFAVADPGSRRGMSTGTVMAAWAEQHHAAWADESSIDSAPVDPAPLDAAPLDAAPLDSDPGSTVMIDP